LPNPVSPRSSGTNCFRAFRQRRTISAGFAQVRSRRRAFFRIRNAFSAFPRRAAPALRARLRDRPGARFRPLPRLDMAAGSMSENQLVAFLQAPIYNRARPSEVAGPVEHADLRPPRSGCTARRAEGEQQRRHVRCKNLHIDDALRPRPSFIADDAGAAAPSTKSEQLVAPQPSRASRRTSRRASPQVFSSSGQRHGWW